MTNPPSRHFGDTKHSSESDAALSRFGNLLGSRSKPVETRVYESEKVLRAASCPVPGAQTRPYWSPVGVSVTSFMLSSSVGPSVNPDFHLPDKRWKAQHVYSKMKRNPEKPRLKLSWQDSSRLQCHTCCLCCGGTGSTDLFSQPGWWRSPGPSCTGAAGGSRRTGRWRPWHRSGTWWRCPSIEGCAQRAAALPICRKKENKDLKMETNRSFLWASSWGFSLIEAKEKLTVFCYRSQEL